MTIILYIFIFILGTMMGSFLNVVIFRFRKKEQIVKGRSHCMSCDHILKWQENIPLVSFIFLKGKCSNCKKKISSQYPLVELATGLLFLLSFIKIFNEFNVFNFYYFTLLLFYFITIFFLILIFIYDLKYYLIPDKITIPAIIIVFILQIVLSLIKNNWQIRFSDYGLLILSAGVLSGFFALQFILSKGKWIGGGDLRLGFLMGIILGWPMGIVALCLAYILGLIYALPMLALGKKNMKSPVAWGTFLSLATLLVLFWGDKILNWYLSLF